MFSVQLFGQLLRERTASACAVLPEDNPLYNRTDQGFEVYSAVFAETDILCCNQGFYQIWRQFIKINPDAVVLTPRKSAEHHSIGRNDLCGKLIYRIFYILK